MVHITCMFRRKIQITMKSDVKTVLAVLEVTAVDVNVTGLSHDDVPKVSKIWTWNCSK